MSHGTVRNYSSELRTEQAAETRRRVLLAAGELFATRGYHGTSRGEIAKAARVSVDTVQATGAKRDLLLHAFELAAAGAEVSDPLQAGGPEVDAVLQAASADALLEAVARWTAGAHARAGRLLAAMKDAAMSDPDVAGMYGPLIQRHRRDVDTLVGLYERLSEPVQAGRRTRLIDELIYFSAPDGYQYLVGDCGWSADDYERWLVVRMRTALAEAAG